MKTENQQLESVQALQKIPTAVQVNRLLAKVTGPNLEIIRRLKNTESGEAHFIGVKKAKVVLTEGTSRQPEKYFLDRGELALSLLGGPDKSPVLDISERIGLVEDLQLRQVRGAVTGKSQSRTEFNTLVPILARAALHAPDPKAIGLVIQQGIKLLDLLHDRLIHRPKVHSSTPTLKQFSDLFIQSVKSRPVELRPSETAALESLGEIVRASTERRMKSRGELSYLVECLMLSEEWAPESGKIVYPILEALYKEEILFWDAVEDCKKCEQCKVVFRRRKKERGRFVKDASGKFVSEEGETVAIFVQSDNTRVVPASRHKDAGGCGITVVRNSRGNVGIFMSRQLGLDHTALWRMIQSLELMRQGWNPNEIPWVELKDWGGHPDVQELWRFLPDESLFANGIAQTDIRPTELTGETLVDAIQHGCYPTFICKWMRRAGIPIPQRVRADETRGTEPAASNQPAPEAKPAADAQAPAPAPSATDPAEPKGVAGKDIAAAFEEAEAKEAAKEGAPAV